MQRSYRHNFTISQDRVLTLAQNWGTKNYGIDLADLCQDDLVIPEELYTISYNFYRVLSPDEARRAVTAKESTIDTQEESSSPRKKSATSLASTSNMDISPKPDDIVDSTESSLPSPSSEGMITIRCEHAEQTGKSNEEIFQQLVKQHHIPEDVYYDLFHTIRLSTSIGNPALRRQYLIIRLQAICITGKLDYDIVQD